jgi:predicted nucleic acid-binding protein
MANYLLDTNHLSPLVTLNHPLRQRVLRSIDAGHRFAICVPVLTETIFGVALLPRAAQNLHELSYVRSLMNCYVPDEGDAEAAADIKIQLRRKGRQLEAIDALIATVALRYKLTLLTADQDFAAVPGLLQQNWLKTLPGM